MILLRAKTCYVDSSVIVPMFLCCKLKGYNDIRLKKFPYKLISSGSKYSSKPICNSCLLLEDNKEHQKPSVSENRQRTVTWNEAIVALNMMQSYINGQLDSKSVQLDLSAVESYSIFICGLLL